VGNDLSGRAMKLIPDLANTITKDDDQRQFMLQVIDRLRSKQKRDEDFAFLSSLGEDFQILLRNFLNQYNTVGLWVNLQ
jgi:hypothetical protein